MPEAQPKNPMQPPNDDIIDLVSNLEPTRNFVCEFCEVVMLDYPQARLTNPYAGQSYICPRCGTVIDSSYTAMRAQVKVEPVDVGMNNQDIMDFVPEDKGPSFDRTPYDPEPQEEEHIKGMGGKILDKRVIVHRDY